MLSDSLLFRLCRIAQHERYGVLTLVNTTGADTGDYTCFPMYCEDTDCRKEYDKAVKVFVFFPGTMNKLFIDAYTCTYQNCNPLLYFTARLIGSLFTFTRYLIYRQYAISSHCTNQTHKNYLFRHLTTTRWFSWGPTGRQSSPARWRRLRLKWLCTASSHQWRWQWTGRRSPLMSRRASPFIAPGLITLEPCTV